MTHHRRAVAVTAVTAAFLAFVVLATTAMATEPLRVRRSFIGMHNLKDGGPPIETGFDWSKEMGCEFVFDWVYDVPPWIGPAFARDLIPCLRIQECNGGCTPNPGYAVNMAWAVLNWKIANPQYADRLVYFQLWNEPGDPRDYVPMDVYIDYLAAAYSGIQQAMASAAQTDPDVAGTIKVMTPGQNNYGDWCDAFEHNPDGKFAFDVWASHPYPESYPPWYNHHDSVGYTNKIKTIDSYVFDLDACATPHGNPPRVRRGFPIMITETAYGDHLGISYEGYAKTSRETAADYYVSAWTDFWYRWPEVIAVHPFILANWSWNHFAFVYAGSGSVDSDSDGLLEPTAPYPSYTASQDAIAALKNAQVLAPARKSAYRGATGSISGSVSSGGQPIPYVSLYTDGYEFGHVTTYDGVYEIHDVPVATYTLTAHKYGYADASTQVTVTQNQTATANFSLSLVGKQHKGIYFEDCIPGVFCSGNCVGCNSSGSQFIGQTFKTPGNVGFIKFVAAKVAVGYPVEIKFSLRAGGPSGALVPGSEIVRLIEYSDAGTMTGIEYPDDAEPVVQPNTTYFLKVERVAGGSIFGFMSDENPYPDGTAYLNTTAVGNWDLKACIRGMTVFAAPTPVPTNTPSNTPTNSPGGPTYTPTNTPDTSPTPPVVANPSFESSLSGSWTMWVGSGGNQDQPERDYLGGNARDGVWVCGVKGLGAGGKGVYQYVNNNWIAGRTYRVSAYVKNVANTNMDYFVGYKLGNTGAAGGTSATYGGIVEHPSSWTAASVEFTYSGSSGVTIYLKAVNDGHSERAGFDLVEILDLGGVSPTSTPTMTPSNTPTNTVPGVPTATPTDTSAPFAGLANGNMEGGFHNDPDADHQVANSWTRWYTGGNTSKSGGFWQPANHSPVWSQAFWEANYTAGMYQQVGGTSSGTNYTASVWVKGDADVEFRIGIDPNGGTSPANAQWSAAAEPGATWVQIWKQVQAAGSTVTVFVEAHNPTGANRNAWIDDAALTQP